MKGQRSPFTKPYEAAVRDCERVPEKGRGQNKGPAVGPSHRRITYALSCQPSPALLPSDFELLDIAESRWMAQLTRAIIIRSSTRARILCHFPYNHQASYPISQPYKTSQLATACWVFKPAHNASHTASLSICHRSLLSGYSVLQWFQEPGLYGLIQRIHFYFSTFQGNQHGVRSPRDPGWRA
ncbi:hypothetical protein LZ554_009056 [Drepanopeziza brunnea f. sp. 'monogermtubi']|nr:hypothetical protein LZ554_009056 [Drepanopeziza brunnea f. sp. 'monogermtubi']